ncbi:MAG: hypothetical protein IJY28_08340 [Clostridia bacterium]|nr:hypothetical protein [Clostridia bacterium]
MKKMAVLLIFILSLCLLTACDPVLPENPDNGSYGTENHVVVRCNPHPLTAGQTAELTLIYPDTEGTAIAGWDNIRVTVVEGTDIVTVEGVKLTAQKAGTAQILVEVDAQCAFMGIIIDTVTYQTEALITVNAG